LRVLSASAFFFSRPLRPLLYLALSFPVFFIDHLEAALFSLPPVIPLPGARFQTESSIRPPWQRLFLPLTLFLVVEGTLCLFSLYAAPVNDSFFPQTWTHRELSCSRLVIVFDGFPSLCTYQSETISTADELFLMLQ